MTTHALLLSCIDLRLMDDIERYMSSRGYRDRYDHITLAGASLGATTDKYPAWNQTFWDHLGIAIRYHDIEAVIVVDHLDCAAYSILLGPEHARDAIAERESHSAQLRKLKGMIHDRHPALQVEMLLMALDGKVEPIS